MDCKTEFRSDKKDDNIKGRHLIVEEEEEVMRTCAICPFLVAN